MHDFRGGRVTEELRRRLLRMAEPGSEAEAIRGGRHGEALTRAKQRLERLLVQEQEVALRNWRERVRTVSGACKWLRQEEAPSQAIQLGDGQVVTHPAQAVETLRDHWAGIFGTPGANLQGYWERFGRFVQSPTTPFPELRPITKEQLREAIRPMANTAGGLDGFTPRFLMCLQRLVALLSLCEQRAIFPEAMKQWKIVFLPKKETLEPPAQSADIVLSLFCFFLSPLSP